MDTKTKKARSRNMALIRSVDTKPELLLRKALFAKGFRYRKNVKNLPGRPDLVFRKYKAVIFVNGCFWHGHRNCSKAKTPSSNSNYWTNKIMNNKLRDRKNRIDLEESGWRVLTVWTCSLDTVKRREKTVASVVDWLKKGENTREIPDKDSEV